MASVFTKIIRGEIPSYCVYEDEDIFSFLDINPVSRGHSLVIPKIEVDYLFDLEDSMLQKLFLTSKRIAKAIESSVDCQRVSLAVVGLEVPHAHIHLIPINEMRDFSFSNPKLSFSAEEFEKIASKIREAL
jgi:histidine triad (HIT) family protein